jgi:hypothetical protein
MRRSIFISHANPADNDFALWLATRLGFLGYQTWVDTEKLKGGETIWQVIQHEIRENTALFIFVLSNASITSEGARRELDYAQTIARSLGLVGFVLPVRLQPVPHADTLIELSGTYYISALENWADALQRLRDKLQDMSLRPDPKSERPHARQRLLNLVRPTQKILERAETLESNWFEIDPSSVALSIYDGKEVLPLLALRCFTSRYTRPRMLYIFCPNCGLHR